MGEEYKKSCHDELNWVEIEQLHTATVEISKNCFEYKKLLDYPQSSAIF